jgi:hypothetical protein
MTTSGMSSASGKAGTASSAYDDDEQDEKTASSNDVQQKRFHICVKVSVKS